MRAAGVADMTGNTLYAYDLCCPYEDQQKHQSKFRAVHGKANVSLVCSVFVTMHGRGNVCGGPQSQSLQSYPGLPRFKSGYLPDRQLNDV